MWLRSLLLALAVAVAAAFPASAQQTGRIGFPPSYRAGLRLPVTAVAGSALSGDCAKTPPSGLTMTACYDFANGSYTNNGSTGQATFTSAGGTLDSSCSISASGLNCTSNQGSISNSSPGSSVFLVTRVSFHGAASAAATDLINSTHFRVQDSENNSLQAATSYGNGLVTANGTYDGRIAICEDASGNVLTSFNGGSSQTMTTQAPVGSATSLQVGGFNGTSIGSGNYLLSDVVFTGTCNATNVQAAGAN